MGYRYTNEVEGGQVIESDDLVPHLEGQALWVRTVIGDPDPELVPDGSTGTEGTPFTAPDVPVFTPEQEGDEESGDPDPELVPDETWTDEALDALGKERGITWRSNASKATKVAKLTEG